MAKVSRGNRTNRMSRYTLHHIWSEQTSLKFGKARTRDNCVKIFQTIHSFACSQLPQLFQEVSNLRAQAAPSVHEVNIVVKRKREPNWWKNRSKVPGAMACHTSISADWIQLLVVWTTTCHCSFCWVYRSRWPIAMCAHNTTYYYSNSQQAQQLGARFHHSPRP